MDKKIKIIDAICEHHPSLGVEKGWSEYTGGMKDTGKWFYRKMLDVPISVLQMFLNKINERKVILYVPHDNLLVQEKLMRLSDEYNFVWSKINKEIKKVNNE